MQPYSALGLPYPAFGPHPVLLAAYFILKGHENEAITGQIGHKNGAITGQKGQKSC